MKSLALSMTALQDAVERLPDDRLSAARHAALAHLREHGLPTTRNEDWKYTDLSGIVDISNRWLDNAEDETASDQIGAIVASVRDSIDADWLVIANGRIQTQLIDGFDVDDVCVTRLSESSDQLTFHAPLGDLNAALLHDGVRIQVGSGAELSRPIGILVIDDATSAPGMSQIRLDIEVADNGSASVIEYHASIGDADHYANSVSILSLGAGSHMDFVRVQERADNHKQTGRLTVRLGKDSEFNHCGFDLGGDLIRNDLVVDIVQPGSCSTFNGLYLVGDQQHIDNHTRADHRVGPAESHQEYKGILTGKARAVWNGKAIVHEGADGTDAEQANHNLLLSDKAEIDAKPELEIYADDVKCSHGTTVGQLDETSLFYLRTRGLDEHEAKQVLTRAFAQSIVSKSPIASVRDVLSEKIAARLGELMRGAVV